MPDINRIIKKAEKHIPGINKIYYKRYIAQRLHLYDEKKQSGMKIKIVNPKKDKAKQLSKLINILDITDIENDTFFYSIDPYKIAVTTRGTTVFDNFTPNYYKVINGHLDENNVLAPCLKRYLERAEHNCNQTHRDKVTALKDIFQKSAMGFVDALQRILFINQIFWQTEHTLVGLGHLDWWLIDLYNKDLEKGIIDSERAKEIIKDFMRATHSNYEYKSNSLIGDTGQIIILGGLSEEGYNCNDLTYLFIDALRELHLPDPKILLRCGNGMPDDLFALAVESISSGIGSPLLSNDELIIPTMIEFGYCDNDAYNYGVSACWEPLVIGKSFDNNNCSTINFAASLSETINDSKFLTCKSIEDVYDLYRGYLQTHIQSIVRAAQARVYDDDPLNNILMDDLKFDGRDFCKGGATYSNTGFTSVGMATVVNSLLNLERYVFTNRITSLEDIHDACEKNFAGYDELQKKLREAEPRFGNDSEDVVRITNRIMNDASEELQKYKTQYGGGYKIGFSSPNYINLGNVTEATPDGRNANTPFLTHISCDSGVAYSEMMNFAAQLKYDDNCFNGNVVDFMVPGSMIDNCKEKFALLLKNAIRSGVFQTQVNIIDSSTLIDAQNHPEKHKDLIVRVWGFSAYFNDLPKEYQDNLIRRAIEAEKAA